MNVDRTTHIHLVTKCVLKLKNQKSKNNNLSSSIISGRIPVTSQISSDDMRIMHRRADQYSETSTQTHIHMRANYKNELNAQRKMAVFHQKPSKTCTSQYVSQKKTRKKKSQQSVICLFHSSFPEGHRTTTFRLY